MRVTIFGGTGPTGQLLVEQALSEGHDVVAYARSPHKLRQRTGLTAVEGTLEQSDKIASAISGSDVVLSVLGPGTNAADIPALITGYRNIVAAMQQHGVRRLVALGTPSITDPADTSDRRVGLLVTLIRTFQPTAYNAIVTIGEIVRQSELGWTIVRVPLLSNGPRTEHVNVRNIGGKGGLRLSRANAAAFILAQASDTTYVGAAPLISD